LNGKPLIYASLGTLVPEQRQHLLRLGDDHVNSEEVAELIRELTLVSKDVAIVGILNCLRR
jgi:hypothetical protein